MNYNDIATELAGSKATQPIHRKVYQDITDGADLKVHPSADLFPLMADTNEEAFDEFCNDIITHGKVNESIKIDSTGQILDGRNRIAAIRAIDEAIDFDVEVLDCTSAHDWIISTNLQRRHLTTSQRAMIAAEMATATQSDGGKMSAKAQGREVADPVAPVTQKDAAKAMGVSTKSVKRAASVVKSGDTAAVKAVKEGKKTVTEAQASVGKAPPSAAKKTTKPKAKEKVTTSATPPPPKTGVLDSEEVGDLKKLCARASETQLKGIQQYIAGLLKVAAK